MSAEIRTFPELLNWNILHLCHFSPDLDSYICWTNGIGTWYTMYLLLLRSCQPWPGSQGSDIFVRLFPDFLLVPKLHYPHKPSHLTTSEGFVIAGLFRVSISDLTSAIDWVWKTSLLIAICIWNVDIISDLPIAFLPSILCSWVSRTVNQLCFITTDKISIIIIPRPHLHNSSQMFIAR